VVVEATTDHLELVELERLHKVLEVEMEAQQTQKTKIGRQVEVEVLELLV
jgi:uncharacterized membrane protein (UPF0127 family)